MHVRSVNIMKDSTDPIIKSSHTGHVQNNLSNHKRLSIVYCYSGSADIQITQKMERGSSDEQQSRRLRRAEDARNTRKENTERLRNTQREGPVWTSTKQSMTYVTVRGIESDTSWQEIEWPKQIMKELISNAWDWLHDYYIDGTKENRKIAVRVKTDSISDEGTNRPIIRIAVRNSNPNNISVFENLNQIFDYTQFHSTKRHQHREVSGALGDFLKRGLGMGYASWTEGYDRERKDSAVASDKQWIEPIIFRHNDFEDKVFIHVNWDGQEYWPVFSDRIGCNAPDFTEVEIAFPLDSILRKIQNHGVATTRN